MNSVDFAPSNPIVSVLVWEESDILLLGIAGMQCPFAVCATLLQEGGKPTKEAC